MIKNYVMLNNVDHYDLKVIDSLENNSEAAKSVVLIFPTEFVHVHKEFPILLSKFDGDKPYQPVALMGVLPNQNLFLDKTSKKGWSWSANYIPAIINRGPFITGLHELVDGTVEKKVFIDVSSPLISKKEGKNVFLTHGGKTPYLEHVVSVLDKIDTGKSVSDEMFLVLDQMGLIEPLTINIDLVNGDKIEITRYSTINEDALHTLSGDNLEKLNKLGYLSSVFFILSSLSNLKTLIDRANHLARLEMA